MEAVSGGRYRAAVFLGMAVVWEYCEVLQRVTAILEYVRVVVTHLHLGT
jgi:hypothetical protein